MPAYIHGDDHYATKLVGVHEGNEARGPRRSTPRSCSRTPGPGSRSRSWPGPVYTNARAACIGALAVCDLAPDARTLGVVGADARGYWQSRAISTVADLETVLVYSPSESKYECAEALDEVGVPATAVESVADAVSPADVVVTAATSTEPVFPAEALQPGTLVVAAGAYTAGLQEIEAAVFDHAARVFADVSEEVATIGDLDATALGEDDLVPLGAVIEGRIGRESPDDVVVVESVGTAVLDAEASGYVYRAARDADVGEDISL